MNKSQLRITGADAKRCDKAVAAVGKLTWQSIKRYPSAEVVAQHSVEFLTRLKMFYLSNAGTVITKETKFLVGIERLKEAISEINLMYAYAYKRDEDNSKIAAWREDALKPITLTLERVEWKTQAK